MLKYYGFQDCCPNNTTSFRIIIPNEICPQLPADLPFPFVKGIRKKDYKIWGRMSISLLIPIDFP